MYTCTHHIDGIASIVVCAGIMAFVILKSDVKIKDEDIVGSLKELVKKKIAAFAIPTAFLVSITILYMHTLHYVHSLYVRKLEKSGVHVCIASDRIIMFHTALHTQVVPGLPKTRSGKIMRRVLRKIAADKASELGDVSTLADPTIVKQIVEMYKTKLIET